MRLLFSNFYYFYKMCTIFHSLKIGRFVYKIGIGSWKYLFFFSTVNNLFRYFKYLDFEIVFVDRLLFFFFILKMFTFTFYIERRRKGSLFKEYAQNTSLFFSEQCSYKYFIINIFKNDFYLLKKKIFCEFYQFCFNAGYSVLYLYYLIDSVENILRW